MDQMRVKEATNTNIASTVRESNVARAISARSRTHTPRAIVNQQKTLMKKKTLKQVIQKGNGEL